MNPIENLRRRIAVARIRMDICRKCEYLKAFNQCGICNCFMNAKTKMMEQECPIGKWGSEEDL